MSLKNWLSPKVLLVLALAMIPGVVCAKKEAWTDPTGKKFKGEPSGLLGPLAVFRTGRTTVQRFPLHYLSEADCVRFAQQLGGKAERAQDWEQSQSLAAQDLPGRVLRVADGNWCQPNSVEWWSPSSMSYFTRATAWAPPGE